LLDELKVSIQPPKAEEDSVSNEGENGTAGEAGRGGGVRREGLDTNNTN